VTTYIVGAGASAHAGYPLGTQLWSRLAAWIIENYGADQRYRQRLDLITALYGPVSDAEALLTDISLGRGAFAHLTDLDRNALRQFSRDAIRAFFRHKPPLDARLYKEMATRHVEQGDVIITFNYELALERQLRLAKVEENGPRKFEVLDGYFAQASGTHATSAVTVLKLHGSVNWLAQIFGGARSGSSVVTNSLGPRPVLDPLDQEYLDYPKAPPCVDPEFTSGGYDSGAALILPTLEKRFEVPTTFGPEWRPFWDSLWYRAAASLGQSNRIVIIGYSVREADVRAREMIFESSNKDADVIVCCGSQSQTLANTFLNQGFRYVRSAGTFENWLRHG
jgi:hypothetical protein